MIFFEVVSSVELLSFLTDLATRAVPTSMAITEMASPQSRDFQILPETSHEVSALVLLLIDASNNTLIGDIKEDVADPPKILVRFGTKISDTHPSSVGFRVLLRTDTPKSTESGSIEENYHLVSVKFDLEEGSVKYRETTKIDKRQLIELGSSRKGFEKTLERSFDQSLYRIDFATKDTNGCIVTHHGPDLRTKDEEIRKMKNMLLPSIAYASKISIVFMADELLIRRLENVIEKNSGVGMQSASWKTALPESLVPKWTSNIQDQMVVGSTDVLNTLLSALREQPVHDGAGTALATRPEAIQFRDHVSEAYPQIRTEPTQKVYPIFLNVMGSLCVDLPFGASMLNRTQTYVGINALHRLLKTNIPASRIRIVTLYPMQVAAYEDALARCHKKLSTAGYDQVGVDVLENWVGHTTGIAIVDLVRTRNASGNLGYLSQGNRIKALLTLHCNGMIVVGDQECVSSGDDSVTSTKLGKVLQWFVDHGRIVDVSNNGMTISTNTNEASDHVVDASKNETTITISANEAPTNAAGKAQLVEAQLQSPEKEPTALHSGPAATKKTSLTHETAPMTQPSSVLGVPVKSEPAGPSSESSRREASSAPHASKSQILMNRRYVGIPGLEHKKVEGCSHPHERIRKAPPRDDLASWASFRRQIQSLSKDSPISSVDKPQLHDKKTEEFARQDSAVATQESPVVSQITADQDYKGGSSASGTHQRADPQLSDIVGKNATTSEKATPPGPSSVRPSSLNKPESPKPKGVSPFSQPSSKSKISAKPGVPFEPSSQGKSEDLAAVASLIEAFKSQCGVDSYEAMCKQYNIKPDLSNVLKEDTKPADSVKAPPQVSAKADKQIHRMETAGVPAPKTVNEDLVPTEPRKISVRLPGAKQEARKESLASIPEIKPGDEELFAKKTRPTAQSKENGSPVPTSQKSTKSPQIKYDIEELLAKKPANTAQLEENVPPALSNGNLTKLSPIKAKEDPTTERATSKPLP